MLRAIVSRLIALVLTVCCAGSVSVVSGQQMAGPQSPVIRMVGPRSVSARMQEEQVAPASPEGSTQERDSKSGVTVEEALPWRPIMELDISPIDTAKRIPEDETRSIGRVSNPQPMRSHPPALAVWEAPNIRYNPLYFEDVVLERYGQTYPRGIQPWASAFRFYVQGMALPYNATIDRPFSCESPLGYCRPGRPTANQRQRLILRK